MLLCSSPSKHSCMLSVALYTSQVLPAPRFQCLARQPLSALSPARRGPRAFTPTNGLLAVGPPPKPLFISASHSAPRELSRTRCSQSATSSSGSSANAQSSNVAVGSGCLNSINYIRIGVGSAHCSGETSIDRSIASTASNYGSLTSPENLPSTYALHPAPNNFSHLLL